MSVLARMRHANRISLSGPRKISGRGLGSGDNGGVIRCLRDDKTEVGQLVEEFRESDDDVNAGCDRILLDRT